MDTDALRWLQQVADGATVTEVSELVAVTQSGVSRALARLEAEVGTPLLRRSGRMLRMTHAGAVFKPHVDALLHQLDDGIAAVGELIDPGNGSVTLAFQQSLGTWLIPDFGPRLPDRAPGRPLPAHPGRATNRARPRWTTGTRILRSGRAGAGPSPRSRLLAVEPLRLALPRDHPLAGQRQVRLAEVAGEPFVGLGRRSRCGSNR